MAAEAKIGALFLVTVILIVVTTVYLSQFALGVRVYDVVVHFADVKGLQPGAEVRLAGVKIGRVVKITLEQHQDFPEQRVAAYLAIEQQVDLYTADEFVVEQGSLIGEQCVSVRRPTAEEIREIHGPDYKPRVVGPGMHYGGAGVVGFAALADESQQLVKQARSTLATMEATYADEYLRRQLHQILVNVNRATAQANKIADEALGFAQVVVRSTKAGEPQVAGILADVQRAADNIRVASEQIQLAVSAFNQGGMPQHIVRTADNLHQASDDIRTVTAATREMIASPATRQWMETMVTNLAETSENLKTLSARAAKLLGDEKTAADLHTTLANVREITENLAVVTERTKVFFTEERNLENIQSTLENLRVVSEEGVEVTRKADRALDRVERTMDRLGEAAKPLSPSQVEGYIGLEATNDRGLRADFDLRLQYGSDPLDFWRVGIRDVGDSERLNLQKSVPLGSGAWVRLGLIQSKAGLGLDYRASSALTLEAEAYNPDDVQLDLRGIYELTPQLWLTVGLADSFGEKLPFVGMRRLMEIRSERKARTE